MAPTVAEVLRFGFDSRGSGPRRRPGPSSGTTRAAPGDRRRRGRRRRMERARAMARRVAGPAPADAGGDHVHERHDRLGAVGHRSDPRHDRDGNLPGVTRDVENTARLQNGDGRRDHPSPGASGPAGRAHRRRPVGPGPRQRGMGGVGGLRGVAPADDGARCVRRRQRPGRGGAVGPGIPEVLDERAYYSFPSRLPGAADMDRRISELDATDGALDGRWEGTRWTPTTSRSPPCPRSPRTRATRCSRSCGRSPSGPTESRTSCSWR